ncbi:MAG: DUF4255 domain-containing protein [Thermomicrobiales bacterium]
MSNSLAIAAVTATVRNLLFAGINTDLPGAEVTTRPPDKARGNGAGNQLNLFLYQTTLDAAWRNMDMPRQVKAGEISQPPLPLILHYLITAYGADDDDTLGHRLLGRAMSVLHDHPLLGADEIRAALPGNDLDQQVERVRITAQPFTLEEMSKLWTTFQTQYRVSAAYQASVVLIESTLPTRTPLPALTRGRDDRGPVALGDPVLPFPTLLNLALPNQALAARLGDVITLTGHHLDGANAVRLSHPRLPDPLAIPPPALVETTATEVKVRLPDDPARFPAGFYQIAAVIPPSAQQLADDPAALPVLTNQLPFPLAPAITSPLPLNAVRDGIGTVRLRLTCAPQVRPDQRASLLLGDRETLAAPHAALTDTLDFVIAAAPGDYWLRLRVDGVDSMLVDRSVTPPRFDPTQKVTIA